MLTSLPISALALVPPAPGVNNNADVFSQVAPWLAALLGVIMLGAIVLAFVRKYMRSERGKSEGFTLQDLRDLHAAGNLSADEYAAARTALVGHLKSPARSAKPANTRKPAPQSDNPPSGP